ncbi:hypothetical protein DFH09DRAFT_1305398 [Mycena vulgaris]|nr:hypothetical protein DFH09DRAFT_1305398 [Mycena vulgaris]
MLEADIHDLGLHLVPFPLLQSATFNVRYASDAPYDAPDPLLTRVFVNLTTSEGQIDDMGLFSLAEATIRASRYMHPEAEPPTAMITHLYLGSLTLIAGYGSSSNVLANLTLPALHSLDISKTDQTLYPSLEAFFMRSTPPFQSLYVNAEDASLLYWHQSLFSVDATLRNLSLHDPSEGMLSRIF